MKRKAILTATASVLLMVAAGQRSALELTFTAVNSAAYVQLDSIRVMNRTQGGDTVLAWPDTVLTLYYTGIPGKNKTESVFRVFQNYPNPSAGQTTLSLFVPEKDIVSLIVSDLTGRVMIRSEMFLDKGQHSFRFNHGGEKVCFFNARWRENSSSIKIFNVSPDGIRTWSLEYLGGELCTPPLKIKEVIQNFLFDPGDTLLFIGYTGGLQSGMLDSPAESQNYSFQFATNIPCPGTPTVTYEGHVYNTIQIFSQCWLKENLDVGTMINGSQNQTDNGIIEKYCYNNSPDSCTRYGGLYQWDEMMQYTTQQGPQGICPPGWHLPTDEEWKVLEGAVDSKYGIGDTSWDDEVFRGFDAGKNLKTTSGWRNNGNGTDLYGFSALPASYRILTGGFDITGNEGVWWMSTPTVTDYAWYRNILFYSPKIGRFNDLYSYKFYGFSVRCVRDN